MADKPITALAKMGERGIQIQDLDSLFRFANMIYQSGLAPSSFKNVQAVACVLELGREYGFGWMQSLRVIGITPNGTPFVYGDGPLALVQSSGHLEYIREWIEGDGDRMVAHCETKRRGYDQACHVTFSVADAKLAKLWNKKTKMGGDTPWVTSPKDMLIYKARSRNLKRQFADCLTGVDVRYSPAPEDDNDIIDVAPNSVTPVATEVDPLGAMLDDEPTHDLPQSPESDAEPSPVSEPLPELPDNAVALLETIEATGKAVEHETRKRDGLIRYILGCEADFDWQASAKTADLQRLVHVLNTVKREYDKSGKPADKDARVEAVDSAIKFVDGELAATIG